MSNPPKENIAEIELEKLAADPNISISYIAREELRRHLSRRGVRFHTDQTVPTGLLLSRRKDWIYSTMDEKEDEVIAAKRSGSWLRRYILRLPDSSYQYLREIYRLKGYAQRFYY